MAQPPPGERPDSPARIRESDRIAVHGRLGVAVVETLLLSSLFLVVDVAEMAWNVEIEDRLAKQIESFVG
jgi:hypothetical protein